MKAQLEISSDSSKLGIEKSKLDGWKDENTSSIGFLINDIPIKVGDDPTTPADESKEIKINIYFSFIV